MKLLSHAFLALLSFAAAATARADVYLTSKHLVILHQGLEQVYGSYVFAVQNTDAVNKAHFKTKVMLPREMDDFVPQEGLEPTDLSLAPEGGVVIDKDFAPGVQIVSIGFKVTASYGRATLTLTPTSDIQSLSVLVPRHGGMTASSSVLAPNTMSGMSDPEYEAMMSTDTLKAGVPIVVEVAGLPEGRSRLWIVGGVAAGMLVLLAGALAWRTRPKVTEDADASVLVG